MVNLWSRTTLNHHQHKDENGFYSPRLMDIIYNRDIDYYKSFLSQVIQDTDLYRSSMKNTKTFKFGVAATTT